MGQLDCNGSLSNTGSAACREDFGMIGRWIIVPPGSAGEFAARADALVEANWETMINAASANDRARPLAKVFQLEANDEETIYEEGSDGAKDPVREGRYDGTYISLLSLCEHKKYRTMNGNKLKGYRVTKNGYIQGTTNGTKFTPFDIELLEVEKQTRNDGSVKEKTRIRIVESNPTEWNDRGWWVKPTAFDPLTDLDGIIDVVLAEVGVSTATSTVFTVKTDCGAKPIDGLVKADFLLVDAAGNDEVAKITSITSNGNGQYTAVWDTLGADTYTLTTSGVGTMTTQGYADTGGFDFTI